MQKLVCICLALVPSLGFGDPCDVQSILRQLRPGAQWNLRDGKTLDWMDAVQIQPSQGEIDVGTMACQATQAQLKAYQVELTTTTAAVANLADGYVSSNVLQQIQINKNMARIIQLRQLLGLP